MRASFVPGLVAVLLLALPLGATAPVPPVCVAPLKLCLPPTVAEGGHATGEVRFEDGTFVLSEPLFLTDGHVIVRNATLQVSDQAPINCLARCAFTAHDARIVSQSAPMNPTIYLNEGDVEILRTDFVGGRFATFGEDFSASVVDSTFLEHFLELHVSTLTVEASGFLRAALHGSGYSGGTARLANSTFDGFPFSVDAQAAFGGGSLVAERNVFRVDGDDTFGDLVGLSFGNGAGTFRFNTFRDEGDPFTAGLHLVALDGPTLVQGGSFTDLGVGIDVQSASFPHLTVSGVAFARNGQDVRVY